MRVTLMAKDQVEAALSEFVKAFNAGERPNPREFIERVAEEDQRELEVLIELAIVESPPRVWDPKAFENSKLAASAEKVYDSFAEFEPAIAWPEALVAWRKRAEVKRSDLVERLAAALSVADKREKVGAYYHELETGTLQPTGVSRRVWEALAPIVDVPAKQILLAVRSWTPTPASPGTAAAFARSVGSPPEIEASAAPAHGAAIERDEVDELFLGEHE